MKYLSLGTPKSWKARTKTKVYWGCMDK